jgi:hypothetical protein
MAQEWDEYEGKKTELKFGAKFKLWKVYETEKGVVAIYKVTPQLEDESEPYVLEPFYLVTLDNGVSEVAWAVGILPCVALKYASVLWDQLSTRDKPNPFRQALEFSQSLS